MCDFNHTLDWRSNLHQKIKDRNNRECGLLLQYLYLQQNSLFHCFTDLDDQRELAKHNLYMAEHEVQEVLNKTNDPSDALEKLKKRVGGVHDSLLPVITNYSISKGFLADARDQGPIPSYSTLSSSSKTGSTSLNLSKIIYEQRKLIECQNEELKIAKAELQTALAQLARVKEELLQKSEDYNSLALQSVSQNPMSLQPAASDC